MKRIESIKDLEAFGIVPLTGESDAHMYRILCDLTEQGKRVIERTLNNLARFGCALAALC
jgi:hypothetical protein